MLKQQKKKRIIYPRRSVELPLPRMSTAEVVDEIINEFYFQQLESDMPLFFSQQFLKKINTLQTKKLSTSELPRKLPGNLGTKPQLVRVEIPRYISLEVGKNNNLMVTGVRGSLIHRFGANIALKKKGQLLSISSSDENKGTNFSTQVGILYRMLVGVTRGYKEKIKTSGVGYRGVLEEGNLLTLFLGYSHQTHHRLFSTVKAKFSRKNNKINFSGPS